MQLTEIVTLSQDLYMKRYAYLDIELNHHNWNNAQIIEIAFIIKNELGEDVDFFESLIRPKNQLNPEITELTGINEQMLKDAPEFFEVAQKIYEKLDRCIIVAHKVDSDVNILNQELLKLGFKLKNKAICTLNLAQKLIPELYSYSLKSLCDLFQIKLENNHRALNDVKALYELYRYLELINQDHTNTSVYLSAHKKIIDKTPTLPGVVIIKGNNSKEIFKTDNLNLKLKDLLILNSKNKNRILRLKKIKTVPTASLTQAGLVKVNIEKPYYPYCLYSLKNKSGKLILKIGKTKPYLKALYFTKTKSEAKKIMQNILNKISHKKFAYVDSNSTTHDTLLENTKLSLEIRKLATLEKNYLIRSKTTLNGKYQYTLIKGHIKYACFEDIRELKSSEQINKKDLNLKNMGPREYMSFTHSLQWIKNQKNKTDLVMEVKNII